MQVRAADVADEECVAGQHSIGRGGAAAEIVDDQRDGVGGVAGCLESLNSDLAEFDGVTIVERVEGILGFGRRPKVDRRANAIAQLEMAGDEVSVQVGEKNVADGKAVFLCKREVLIDISLRVDDGGGFGLRVVANDVRRVGQAPEVELLEYHGFASRSIIRLSPPGRLKSAFTNLTLYYTWSFMRLTGLLLALPTLCAAATPPQHPRLYLTPQRIVQLREEITTFRKPHWEVLRAQADKLLRRHPPDYDTANRGNDAEQLWQRDVGNAFPTLAMAWLLTGDAKYRSAVEEWALASCGYPTWGGSGKYDGTDLAAGHQLFGLALVYDWMYRDLDPHVRDTIHDTLLNRGRGMFKAANPDNGSKTGAYWRDEFMQNHLWVNATGLTAAALALSDEPETARWIEVTRDKFRRSDDALGSDGASHEGVGYWSYGTEYLLKFWALSADLLGEDLRSPWWSKTAMYRLYLGLPRLALDAHNAIVDIADCPRRDYYGPDYILFNLAHRFHDAHAQWLALDLERAHVTADIAPFLNLLWFDPNQQATPPDDLPTLRHFEDLGIVSARSDWSGKESLVVFKSGPPAGHDEVKKGFTYDPGFGHVHPDANHFVVFGAGKWIIQDDGYRWKETGQHNTLLVDGFGQKGEHGMWFRPKPPLPVEGEPTILAAESNAKLDLMAGDATGAYVREAGLRRYVRRLVFWKPATLLVLDDIETDRPRDLELRFHPAEKANTRVDDLTPDGVVSETGLVEGKDRDGKPFPQYTVRMTTHASKWRHAVAISWPNAGAAAAVVKMTRAGDRVVFAAAGEVVL